MRSCILPIAFLAICPSATLASAADVPASVIAHEKRLADACREVGGVPAQPSAGFLAHADLNGDGIDDWALDEGKANCTGAAGTYGGSGGSQVVVFVGLPGGDARQAFQNGADGMYRERSGTIYTLWLRVAGPLCGQANPPSRADAIRCDRPLAWHQSSARFEFAPLTRVRIPRRSVDH